jgi:UDP-2-acetamido-3-amino-2,3-dideoxy-glucuronate N-acetyltransferase
MTRARIGDRCNIGQNVLVSPEVTIGDNVKIQNNVSLYTGVIVEEDAFLGPSMVFTNVINPRSHINRKNEYQTTLVKKGASIGANATIMCGTTLGRYCFVGAGSVVTHDVPDYALVYGSPARLHGWMCQCGEQIKFVEQKGVERAVCASCGDAYRKQGQVVVPEGSAG